MKYFKLYITYEDSGGISTNLIANNPIITWTLRNIHISYNTHFQAKQHVNGKNEIKKFLRVYSCL